MVSYPIMHILNTVESKDTPNKTYLPNEGHFSMHQ